MYQKILTVFLSFLGILLINNPAIAINQEAKVQRKIINLDNYNISLNNFVNVSQNSEPIYLARERRTRDSITGEFSWAWIGSIFLPGLGQILLGEVWRGLLFFGVSLAGIIIILFNVNQYSDKALYSVIYGLLIQLLSTIDAYFLAKGKAEGNEEARILNEKIAKFEEAFSNISIKDNNLNYNLAKF